MAADGLADAVDAFCEGIAFTPEQTARVFATATDLGLPVKLHADQLSDLAGAALAARFGALSADHVEYTSEDGARAMADSGTTAVLLPGAFYMLRETQVPPVDAFRRHGVPMALATDCNPGSAPVLSLLAMASMGCTFFRLTPEEALAGITRHGARALGLQDELGTLEVGKPRGFGGLGYSPTRGSLLLAGRQPQSWSGPRWGVGPADRLTASADLSTVETFELTDIHIQLLRRLAVSWDITEAGAPTVEPAAPYGSLRLYDGMAPVLGLPELDPDEEPTPEHLERIEALHDDLRYTFPILLDCHGLKPGRYSIEDRPAFLHDTGRLSWSTVDIRRDDENLSDNRFVRFFQIFKSVLKARRSMEEAEDAGPATVEFEIQGQHLTLLASMTRRWEEHGRRTPVIQGPKSDAKTLEDWIAQERLYPVPCFDPKRPYGDRTDYERDMADILGMVGDGIDGELGEHQSGSLTTLHREMQMVLQTVIQHGHLRAGTYRFSDSGWRFSKTP